MATLPRMKPKTFYDLAVEVALIRPGPIQGTFGASIPAEAQRGRTDPLPASAERREDPEEDARSARCSRSS